MLIHVFTHSSGFIESFDLAELQQHVAELGLVGGYSTREQVSDVGKSLDIKVSTYQAKAALVKMGVYSTVEAFIKSDAADPMLKLRWEYLDFKRSDPDVINIGTMLGLDLDELFLIAQSISA